MSNQPKPNPFDQAENLAPIFESSDRYQSTKSQSLNQFKTQIPTKTQQTQTTPKPNLNFNLSHFMSYNFTHFTRFSIAGLSLFTVLAGGVATQALAPDNLKPTQVVQSIKDKYFGVNKQSDPDPQVALVGDGENYLAYLEGCDLGIKFPKIIDGKEAATSFYDSSSGSSYVFGPKYDHSMMGTVYENEFKYSVNCSPLDKRNNDPRYGILAMYGESISKVSIDINQLKKETGWFASNENTITNTIKFTQKNIDPDTSIFNSGYSFDYNGKKVVVLLNKELSKTSLKFIDFQLQFGSQLTQSVKSNKELFASNLPTTKDTNCDNLLSLSYAENPNLNISKSNTSTGGNISFDNLTYTNNEFVRKDSDTQIIIGCNEIYFDTFKESSEYNNKLNIAELPSVFTQTFRKNIKPDTIYGQRDNPKYGNDNYSIILQDKKGNNLRFMLFNSLGLTGGLKLQIDLK